MGFWPRSEKKKKSETSPNSPWWEANALTSHFGIGGGLGGGGGGGGGGGAITKTQRKWIMGFSNRVDPNLSLNYRIDLSKALGLGWIRATDLSGLAYDGPTLKRITNYAHSIGLNVCWPLTHGTYAGASTLSDAIVGTDAILNQGVDAIELGSKINVVGYNTQCDPSVYADYLSAVATGIRSNTSKGWIVSGSVMNWGWKGQSNSAGSSYDPYGWINAMIGHNASCFQNVDGLGVAIFDWMDRPNDPWRGNYAIQNLLPSIIGNLVIAGTNRPVWITELGCPYPNAYDPNRTAQDQHIQQVLNTLNAVRGQGQLKIGPIFFSNATTNASDNVKYNYYRREAQGFNHAGADSTDINNMYTLLGGANNNNGRGGWFRVAPQAIGSFDTTALKAEILQARQLGMRAVVCGLSPSFGYDAGTISNANWQAYWNAILACQPDAVECWNEPNNAQFSNSAPDPIRMANLCVLLRGYVNTYNTANNTAIQVWSPAATSYGANNPTVPGGTTSVNFQYFWTQMLTVANFAASFDVISIHAYANVNDTVGDLTNATFYTPPIVASIDSTVFAATGKHLPVAWSEYGAPSAGTANSGTYTATGYANGTTPGTDTQHIHVAQAHTNWQGYLNSGTNNFVKIIHTDSSRGTTDGNTYFGITFKPDGPNDFSWKNAAQDVNNEAGISTSLDMGIFNDATRAFRAAAGVVAAEGNLLMQVNPITLK